MTHEMNAVEVSIVSKTPEKSTAEARFVEGAIMEVGHAMSRYMDPTPISGELLDPQNVSSDKKVAEILSRVKDNSPKIDPTTEQGIAEATENMVGRVDAAIEQAIDPVVKEKLKDFKDKNVRKSSNFLTRSVSFGMRNFLKAVSAGTLVAVLASCAPNIIGPFVIPGDSGGTQPTPTEVAPTATTEPTNTPEPTEIPGSVSSKELLAECPVIIEFETALVGKVRVAGKDTELNYPGLRTKITFAIDNSILGTPQAGIPLKELELNTAYWDSRFGEGAAQRQVFADFLYAHFRAWQSQGKDEADTKERGAKTFEDYLKMISEGGDGSHTLLVNAQSWTVTPTESLPIEPLNPIIVVFTNRGNYIESRWGFSYDKTRNTLIIRLRPYLSNSDLTGIPDGGRANWKEVEGYMRLITLLSAMSLPARYQESFVFRQEDIPFEEASQKNVVDKILYNFQDFDGIAPFHPPVKTIYEGK